MAVSCRTIARGQRNIRLRVINYFFVQGLSIISVERRPKTHRKWLLSVENSWNRTKTLQDVKSKRKSKKSWLNPQKWFGSLSRMFEWRQIFLRFEGKKGGKFFFKSSKVESGTPGRPVAPLPESSPARRRSTLYAEIQLPTTNYWRIFNWTQLLF